MKRISALLGLLFLCSMMYARTVIVRDSTRSKQSESWTENFATPSSYPHTTYTHNGHTWNLKNGEVTSVGNVFGSGNICVRLKANGSLYSADAASLTSEKIQGVKEIRFKSKKAEGLFMSLFFSTNGDAWNQMSIAGYNITVRYQSSSSTQWQSITWDQFTNANATNTYSIVFPDIKDCYIRWIVGKTSGANAYAYIDDIEIIRYPWEYSTHEEEQWDQTKQASIDEIGIMCREKAIWAGAYTGAEFYEIAYREGPASAPTNLVVEQVTDLEAGMPYIYKATAAQIAWDETGDAVLVAKNKNGLYGNLGKVTDSSILEDTWVIRGNELWQVGTGCTMGANKGYIKMEEVLEQIGGSATPGRKALSIGISRGTATELEDVTMQTNQCSPMKKLLQDGRILLIRDGQYYDLLGNTIR